MHADFPVILDACVLANAGVCDLFLRLAEPPRLYLPQWSSTILDEVKRTQLGKLNPAWPEDLTNRWRQEVAAAFPEATIEGFEHLLPQLTNHEKDRHVLAAAIQGGIETIVTFNLRDFPEAALSPWSIEAVHLQDYLLTLYGINPAVVVGKLGAIANFHEQELQDVLIHLGKSVPAFSCRVLEDSGQHS